MVKDLELLEKYIPKAKRGEALKKYQEGYPLQYLIGDVDFYGYKIKVDENVLIPRFETEYLVEKTLNLLKKYNFENPNILDLATGSGCIAIALKKEITSNVSALDYKNNVLEIAKQNALNNKATINFQKLDILKEEWQGNYDLIISNPPYVSYQEPTDPKTKYEPQDAIFALNDGLIFYENIAKKSKNVLKKKSIIALEMGYNQKDKVISIFKKFYPEAKIYGEKDLNNFDRYIFVLNNCE